MVEDVLTLPLLAHPFVAVISTYMWICDKGGILCANIRSCVSITPILRLCIVTSPVGLEEETRCA